MNSVYEKPMVEIISLEALEDIMTEDTSAMGVDYYDGEVDPFA